MNKIIVLDTETTGFQPGEIAQLSYIIIDNELKAKNYFFKVKQMEEGAAKVHGFTLDILEKLSGGQVFKDVYEEVFNDFKDTLLICHNVSFDHKFLRIEFQRLNIKLNIPTFCTMEYYTDICKLPGRYDSYKWPRLSEMIDHLEITEEEVLKLAKDLFKSDDIGFHDARFDTAGLYLAFEKGIRNGDIKNKKINEFWDKKNDINAEIE